MNEVRLQGMGVFEGTPAKEIKIGNVLVWNYGATSKVIGVEFSKTGKTLTVTTISNSDGKQYQRKLGANRLVVIE